MIETIEKPVDCPFSLTYLNDRPDKVWVPQKGGKYCFQCPCGEYGVVAFDEVGPLSVDFERLWHEHTPEGEITWEEMTLDAALDVTKTIDPKSMCLFIILESKYDYISVYVR